MDRNIDTLRTDITEFTASVSMRGGRKFVIIDEADNLNQSSFQPAFRAFLDANSRNNGFILTANYPDNIIGPLRSRLAEIQFIFTTEEKEDLCYQFLNSVKKILKAEKVTFDINVLAKVIIKYNPDWRKILNELQAYATRNKMIDAGILANQTLDNIGDLVSHIKNKDFKGARKWVGENSYIHTGIFYRSFYDQSSMILKSAAVPLLIQLIAKYQFQAAFAIDQEINNMAFVVDVMRELHNEFR